MTKDFYSTKNSVKLNLPVNELYQFKHYNLRFFTPQCLFCRSFFASRHIIVVYRSVLSLHHLVSENACYSFLFFQCSWFRLLRTRVLEQFLIFERSLEPNYFFVRIEICLKQHRIVNLQVGNFKALQTWQKSLITMT